MSDASESVERDDRQKTAAFQRLLARSKQGDVQAIDDLFQHWWPCIQHIVRRQLNNHSSWRQLFDCDDCSQDVALQLWNALLHHQVSASTPTQFRHLIERMVKVHILRTWSRLTAKRRDWRRVRSLDAITEEFESRLEEVWQIADHDARIEQLMRLMNAEEYELVWNHLMGLEWEDLSRQHGVTVAGVRSRYYRVIRRLRSEFPSRGGGGQHDLDNLRTLSGDSLPCGNDGPLASVDILGLGRLGWGQTRFSVFVANCDSTCAMRWLSVMDFTVLLVIFGSDDRSMHISKSLA